MIETGCQLGDQAPKFRDLFFDRGAGRNRTGATRRELVADGIVGFDAQPRAQSPPEFSQGHISMIGTHPGF